MPARKLPARHKSGPLKGKFKAAPKKNPASRPAAKKTAARKPAAKKTAARRNPPRPKTPQIVDTLIKGGVQATQMLVGEAVVRSVPQMANMPKEGPMGLAVQAGTAIVTGYVATMFLSRQAAAAITAGGLAAPIRSFIVAQDLPWIGRALSPVQVQAGLSAYVRRPRVPRKALPPSKNVSSYVAQRSMAPMAGVQA